MALFYNANKGKNDPQLERKDFYRFSDEGEEQEKVKIDPEELKRKADEILKHRKRG